MQAQNLSFSKTLNPSLSNPEWLCLTKPFNLHIFSVRPPRVFIRHCVVFNSQNAKSSFPLQKPSSTRRLPPPSAGRSKKTAGGPSPGRIEGSAELRRQAKRNARRKSRKLAESLFYRLKNPHKSFADNFSEEELQMIGLGYDRMVRFMSKDDPNLKHPYDWYKYGEFGPYSWRGVVVGEPVRGRISDECVTMIGEVRDHEEWEKIEQHEMAVDFGKRLNSLDKAPGLRCFWVFVRHPRWRVNELPWQQWTLACEVVLEAGKQRLDKWNLMGRLGNRTRKLITQCAAWMRPDIIYVKRPVYQCRFEPQDEFFSAMIPLLDPETEGDYLFELEDDEGRVELCTYFGGLCKIVRVSPKAFVDDVVKGYEKLSDEKKSKCLKFLLTNHPVQLLHPYTKEWKAKLEEMELGCDAPDDEDGLGVRDGPSGEKDFTEWIEDDDNNDSDGDDDLDDDIVIDENEIGDDKLGIQDDDLGPEEDEKYWKEEFNKAIRSNEAMENLVRTSAERMTKFYQQQLGASAKVENAGSIDDGDETALRGKRAKVTPEEWKYAGYGPWRKRIKKTKIPPELFLRAAVRPFTYKNLVKEIVLTRHAILDGEIGQDKRST
ncbi:hypothetical protein Nepgr_026758 [Nepenthes gracilis]|uniref:Uncharacterized protein n=1 Tax=Nepenthes gracilis TaxID=150966 RepID=A0AAD3Y2B9_NEPGR|nr:hypothetical protein Nepgr_026758 [Nepenthes gracilis]